MYTCKKRFCYSFSLLKYRYEISIVDISTLLKNIDIDIDIDKAILKNIDIDKAIPKISISISIWWFWKISISISISIRQFCKISISIKYRIDSNLAYRTGLVERANGGAILRQRPQLFDQLSFWKITLSVRLPLPKYPKCCKDQISIGSQFCLSRWMFLSWR